ncbi:MAG TPA: beta-ketoacyl-[acyl-carrier-protein] synthase family protein [Chthoniobacterales bacterium]|jgi:3-oxoacyl-[acyl-carrier-protein] synthase II|nr:beta-ketoacyl-[acyl-carrier-protein] synthase family protein [Chthoniobacterales bacterium]
MPDSSTISNPSKNARVAVVAAGIVSPLGFGTEETLAALREARDCVTPVTGFPVDRCRCQTAGQVPDVRLQDANEFHEHPERLHRVAQMMILALREALAQAGDFQPELTVMGTTSGGMTFGEQYYRSLNGKAPKSARHAASLIANYTPQKPIMDAQEAFGIGAPCQVIANACASGTNAIGHAFHCVRSGRYQRVLTGGYDAISELVFVGFDSLQAATPDRCRPFDKARTGLVLGEGAAVLALENLEAAEHRGATILAEVVGYGLSTDNFHLTQPDPSGSGPRSAMETALQSAEMSADEIDYINAHGTATPFNDASEGKAIAELFDEVPVSSTKGMMGHSLGAAGAIEAIIGLLAIRHQMLPANINFREGDAALDLNIIANQAKPAAIRTVLSNSFGFGGTNASIIMRSAAA